MDNWVAMIVRQLLAVISPELRTAMVEFVGELEKRAKETPNPWDDIAVGILKTVLLMK